MSDRPLYWFAGGGTGGHLTPGLALAEAIQRDDPGCRILFVGSDRPLEKRLIGAAGHEHRVLPVESSASLLRHPLRFAWRNWRAYRTAKRLLLERRPAAVIGLGGFVSVPAVIAAARADVPTLILEQNAIPGRATRMLAHRVGAVCLAFDEARSHLSGAARVELTGNPVRAEIARLGRETASVAEGEMRTLLVLGGSQGAEGLNDAVTRVVLSSRVELAGWRVVHQTGVSQADQIESAYSQRGIDHVVSAFFDDLPTWYRQGTLAVSRAGATTLAELACAGCPAILIPYPHAADRHQQANARSFAQSGAAMIVEQAPFAAATAEALSAALVRLASDPEQRRTMSVAMRTLACPEAAANVLRVLRSLVGARQNRAR